MSTARRRSVAPHHRTRTRTTDAQSGTAANRADRPRLADGAMAPLLLDHMNTYPDQDFSPYDLAKVLGRSHGAIRTRLLALANSGDVVRTRIRPARFRIARPTL